MFKILDTGDMGSPCDPMLPEFEKRLVNQRVNGKTKRMGIMTWWSHEAVPHRKKACNGNDKKCGIRRTQADRDANKPNFRPNCD